MALQDIVKTLEAEAEEELKQMQKKADEEISRLKDYYSKKTKETQEKLLNQAGIKAKKEAEMQLFTTKSELQRKVLARKREIIDEVYSEVLKKLKALSDNEYRTIVKDLLADLPAGGNILPAKGKEAITKELVKKASSDQKVAHESINSVGGFVWQSAKVNIDNTFEQLVRDIREKTEITVANELFKEK
ncbi:hypothetical protein KKG41_04195 [Patescibacteria group bacterium]|nr:hypothetical protein [Patescibacteria group bacterium]